MGIQEGKNRGGGRKFTRLFPIVPDLLKKSFFVNFHKMVFDEKKFS